MTVHKLEINVDKKCPKCGREGVPCLHCMADKLKEHITRDVLQEMAGDIEKLLLEKQEQIEWAFKHVPDGFKISIGVNIEHTVPVSAEYTVSFPLEPAHEPVQKEKVTLKKVIGQGEMDL